jgi:fumarate reductase subunit C
MTGGLQHTAHQPKSYRPRMPLLWWLKNGAYTKFMLRELTCVFVAFFAFVYLWELRAVAQGADAYAQFLARLGTPLFVTLNFVALLFVLFHAITWINLTPTVAVVRIGGTRVPDGMIVGSNYLAWAVISGVIVWLFAGG